MDIFQFNPATIFSFLLTLMRLSLVVFMLPFFGGGVVPTPIKVALCLVLTLAVWPMLSFPGTALPANIWSICLMLFGEVTLGLMLSMVVRFLFAAIQFGGMIMGFQMGFAMVNVIDPLTGVNNPVTSHFLYMVSLLCFLTFNGHLYLIKALAQSFVMVPPGGLYISQELGLQVLNLAGQIFVLALQITAPVMTAVFMVDLALALISRVAPQMNLIVLGFPLKITVGFAFMSLIFTYLARHVQEYVAHLGPMFQNLMEMGTK
ncbi:MAG: flagellar biosynthetic protein FliR [Desulfovibrio sp.]|uniref:flagellar biosynthetic protein FliR n=1 Tax=Desulfovibrio sp. 7SRBS1 TaxID=3378064 RepID=UPI003B3D8A7C